jgi:hypothetical protein
VFIHYRQFAPARLKLQLHLVLVDRFAEVLFVEVPEDDSLICRGSYFANYFLLLLVEVSWNKQPGIFVGVDNFDGQLIPYGWAIGSMGRYLFNPVTILAKVVGNIGRVGKKAFGYSALRTPAPGADSVAAIV